MINNQQRARFAKIMLIISAVMALVVAIFVLSEIVLLKRIYSGRLNINDNWVKINPYLNLIFWGLNLLTYILTAYSFIAWQHRAYKNLKRVKVETQYAPHMAIWAWFIPIINLFRPLLIVKEICSKTQMIYLSRSSQIPRPSRLYTFWWILFLIGEISAIVVTINAGGNLIEESTQFITSLYYISLSKVPMIIAAFLGFLVVRNIARYEAVAIQEVQINQIGHSQHKDSEYFTEEAE